MTDKLTTTWVTGCMDCPMCDKDERDDGMFYWCCHPKDPYRRLGKETEPNELGDFTPDDCPLKQGPILINFK